MATAKPPLTRQNKMQRAGPRRHRLRNGLVAALVLAALGMALFWHTLQARAVLAASYGARIACTCHYIAGRGLTDCRKDFEPGMALVMLSDNAEARSITARVPLMASQTARFRDGAGCILESWAP
jgi:hypothetical protein